MTDRVAPTGLLGSFPDRFQLPPMPKWGFVDQCDGRKKIVVRKDLIDEMIHFLKEEAGGTLKGPVQGYVAMIAARFAQYADQESSALKNKYERGEVLVAELEAVNDDSGGTTARCYVVAPGSAAGLSQAEEHSLRQRAAKELGDFNGNDPDRAEAALYGIVLILAMIYFFW